MDRSTTNLWFSSRNTVTPLHYDTADNWFAQVYGSKTITLIDPKHTKAVYGHSAGAMPHVSPVDPRSPDLVTYPRFAEVETCTLSIEAGQMLFLPAFWWHHVCAEETSISTNQWERLELGKSESENAIRYWVALFQRDAWLQYRTTEGLLRPALLQEADRLRNTNPALAVLATMIAVDELARWPSRLEPAAAAAIESVGRPLRDMTAAVTDRRSADVTAERLSDIIQTVRGVEARHAALAGTARMG